MKPAGQAQRDTEKHAEDKFKFTEDIALSKLTPQTTSSNTGRISPQISCTVALEDKEALNELTLFLSNKKGKALNTSTIIRALIRLGKRYKEELIENI